MVWIPATIKDLDLISENIIDNTVKIASGSISNMEKESYVAYTERLLSNPDYQTWMQFKNEKLDQYFTVYNLKTLPYYIFFNYRKIQTPENLFGNLHKQWDDVLDFIVPIQENNNLYSFYTLRVAARSGRKIIFDRRTRNMQGILHPFHKKYTKTIEEYIPRGESSKYETFQKLMFRGSHFEEDVFITKYICKQKYRNNVPVDLQENFLKLEQNIEDKINQNNKGQS